MKLGYSFGFSFIMIFALIFVAGVFVGGFMETVQRGSGATFTTVGWMALIILILIGVISWYSRRNSV